MNKFMPIATLAIGGFVGFFLGWNVHAKKTAKDVDEAVESTKNSITNLYKKEATELNEEEFKKYVENRVENAKKKKEEEKTVTEPERKAYYQITKDYSANTVPAAPEMTLEERAEAKPHLIYGEEFGQELDTGETYDTVELLLFKDGILATENEMEIVSIEDTVSMDALHEFDVNPAVTTIYVRNDRLKIDYEVFKYDDTYEGLLKERPYLDKEL